MSPVTKAIIALCLLPLFLFIWLVMRNETKPKKNIIIGTSLPPEARNDPRVAEICRRFRRALLIAVSVTILAFSVPLLLDSYLFIAAFCTISVTAGVAAFILIYSHFCAKLRRLKSECGWGAAANGQSKTLYVSLDAGMAPPVRGKWATLIMPTALSLLPAVLSFFPDGFHASEFFGSLAMSTTVVIFWLCFRFCYRNKAEIVDGNEELTAALTRLRRYSWCKCRYLAAWVTAAFALPFWASVRFFGELALLITGALYSALLIIVILRVELRVRTVQQRLTEKCGATLTDDDDSYWIAGQFYFNPNDKRLVVNNRVGLSTTVNIARPAGKAIVISVLVLLLAIPVLCGSLIMMEFTPRELTMTDGEIVASQLTEMYRIPLEEIVSVELVDELPRAARVAGMGIDNLSTGRFDVEGYGICRVFLNPQTAPFIIVKTNGWTYILNFDDPDGTHAFFATLNTIISEKTEINEHS